MPPLVFDLQTADDLRDVVHRSVQALTEGKLVVFPTETVYCVAASALHEGASQQLNELLSRPGYIPLAVKGLDEAIDYVPDMSGLGQRLARRCWPGPLTLAFAAPHPESLTHRLPTGTQQVVLTAGTLALNAPAHKMLQEVLRLMVGPILLAPAHHPGDPDSVTAQQVQQAFGDRVAVILDDGRTRFAQQNSLVQVVDGHYEMLRAGVVSEQHLQRLSSLMIVFVCTGNTCRSPMAEGLCRKILAEKIGCPPDQLEERGVLVMSAGVSAAMGGRAAMEAILTLRDQGVDLSGHVSQPLTGQMIRQADYLWVMTRSHLYTVLSEFPEAASRTKLICRDESDLSDPIGGPIEVYRQCAAQLENNLRAWVDEIPL